MTALSDNFHGVQMISMFSEKEDLFLEWNYNAKVISMGGQRSPRVLLIKKVRLMYMMVHYRISYIRYLPDVSPMTRCDWLRGMPPGLALCMLTFVTYLVPRYFPIRRLSIHPYRAVAIFGYETRLDRHEQGTCVYSKDGVRFRFCSSLWELG